MTLVVVALLLALVGCAYEVRAHVLERRRKIAECEARGHRWTYYSLYNAGVFWHRQCLDCPKSEPVQDKDVPPELRE